MDLFNDVFDVADYLHDDNKSKEWTESVGND